MKILAYEYRSARYQGSEQSASGFRGDLLLRGALADLCRLHAVEVILVRDPTLPFFKLPASVRVLPCGREHATATITACIRNADAVWPVAPESADILEAASRHILDEKRLLIGCAPDAVRIAASKHKTSATLKAAGIPVVDTYRPHDPLPDVAGAWVIKPDDGAGCTDTHIFPDRDTACAWVAEQGPERYVLQPYVHGRHRSLSLVCAQGQVLLLSLDEQRIAVSDNQLHYMGSTVNGVNGPYQQCRLLAERVLAALPGLWGYVGIDFIMGDDGPVVLEINPRTTVSHGGLHESMGHNPAALLVELLQTGRCERVERRRVKPISVDVNAFAERRPLAREVALRNA
ncbi:MAG: ATP-grasp domain-containing protein [Burkholderiaceae bacterium]